MVGAVDAQPFPSKPVRIILPYAGGSTDFISRILAQKLSESWGRQVIVDTRPGAGGNIAIAVVARAAPDGYAVGVIANANAINESLYKKVSYHLLTDFLPVAQLSTSSYLIVSHPSLQTKSIKQLIALAKAKPDAINYGSGGSSAQLATELFKMMAGIKMTNIPYKSSGQAVIDLMSGQISLLFSAPPSVYSHVRAGRLQALAVTGVERSRGMPEIPTVAEAGLPQYKASSWTAIITPAGVPADIINTLNTEIVKVLNRPEVKELVARDGGNEVLTSTPEQFGTFLKSEIAKWADVIKKANIPQE